MSFHSSDDEEIQLSRTARGQDRFGRPCRVIDVSSDEDAGSGGSNSRKRTVDLTDDSEIGDEDNCRKGDGSRWRKEGHGHPGRGESPLASEPRRKKSRSSSKSSSTPSPPPSAKGGHTSPSRRSPSPQTFLHMAWKALQGKVDNAASYFVEKYVHALSEPRAANIRLSGKHRALIDKAEMNNREALQLIALLHSVDRRLHERLDPLDCAITWPPHVKKIINQKTAAQIRSILNQGTWDEGYTGIRVCTHCANNQQVGHLPAQCKSDPIERNGCSAYRANKKRPCDQRMTSSNPNFVYSKLRHTTTECAKVNQWSTAMNVAIALARDLRNEVRRYPDFTPLTGLATQLHAKFFAPEGIEVSRGRWETSREDIGAENGTREGEGMDQRFIRKLDHGKERVWSMRIIIKTEETAFDRYIAACDSTRDIIDRIEIDLITGPSLPLPSATITCLLRRIVEAFKEDGGVEAARVEVEAAREKLGRAAY